MIKRISDVVLEMNCAINNLKDKNYALFYWNMVRTKENKTRINHTIKKNQYQKYQPGQFLFIFQHIMLFIILKKW